MRLFGLCLHGLPVGDPVAGLLWVGRGGQGVEQLRVGGHVHPDPFDAAAAVAEDELARAPFVLTRRPGEGAEDGFVPDALADPGKEPESVPLCFLVGQAPDEGGGDEVGELQLDEVGGVLAREQHPGVVLAAVA